MEQSAVGGPSVLGAIIMDGVLGPPDRAQVLSSTPRRSSAPGVSTTPRGARGKGGIVLLATVFGTRIPQMMAVGIILSIKGMRQRRRGDEG